MYNKLKRGVFSLLNDKNDNSVTKSIDFVTTSVVKLLCQQEASISTAESCTGGMLSEMITSVAGASDIFEMGITSYSNRMKTKLLGVSEEILKEHGAVSQQTAIAMAEGAIRQSGSQIGVGITGVAGPTGGSEKKPVGTVYVSVVRYHNENRKVLVRNLELYKETDKSKLTRENVRKLTTLKALEMVLEICEKN